MVFALSLLLFLPRPASAAESAAKLVHLKTKDGWTLAALYHPPAKGRPAAVLIHGVGSSKAEWEGFSAELWKLGYGTLALDLRGHGESRKGPRGDEDYSGFDASGEWPRAEKDLATALKFLGQRGVPPARVALIGASIGANLAARAAPKDLLCLVLLSPGRDYRGVSLPELKPRKVLAAASAADPYAYETTAALARAGKAVSVQAASGHGVQMFADRSFTAALLSWLGRAAGP